MREWLMEPGRLRVYCFAAGTFILALAFIVAAARIPGGGEWLQDLPGFYELNWLFTQRSPLNPLLFAFIFFAAALTMQPAEITASQRPRRAPKVDEAPAEKIDKGALDQKAQRELPRAQREFEQAQRKRRTANRDALARAAKGKSGR